MTQPIWTLAAVGSASHMSPGAPAAEMSAKEIAGRSDVTEVHGSGAWMLHGKTMPLAWTQYPTKPAMATRPGLISAWRNQPIVSGAVSSVTMPSGSQKPTTGFCLMASAFMSSRFLGSVDTSQPRPVAWVKGGPTGLQPPSSSSDRMRTRLAAAIWLHMAADLVLPGSAATTDMIFASTSLSARTISDFMLTAPRVEAGIFAPWTSEMAADESIMAKGDDR